MQLQAVKDAILKSNLIKVWLVVIARNFPSRSPIASCVLFHPSFGWLHVVLNPIFVSSSFLNDRWLIACAFRFVSFLELSSTVSSFSSFQICIDLMVFRVRRTVVAACSTTRSAWSATSWSAGWSRRTTLLIGNSSLSLSSYLFAAISFRSDDTLAFLFFVSRCCCHHFHPIALFAVVLRC